MRTDTIVGYSFRADIYCPEHIVPALGRGTMPAYAAEEELDAIAAETGIDRGDESSFDSDDFPKVAFRDQVRGMADYPLIDDEDGCETADRCATCHRLLA